MKEGAGVWAGRDEPKRRPKKPEGKPKQTKMARKERVQGVWGGGGVESTGPKALAKEAVIGARLT